MLKRIAPKIINRKPSIKRIIPTIENTKTTQLKGIDLINSLSKEQINKIKPNFNFKIPNSNKDKLYIIAGGPSVLKHDLKSLTDGDTMVINRAIEHVDSATYFITMDYMFLRDKIKPEQLNKAKYKIFILNTSKHLKEHKELYYDTRFGLVYENLWIFDKVFNSKYVVAPETGFSLNDENFANGENSGFCALQAAILLNYKKIILIGFDLNITNKTHFHGGYGQNPGGFVRSLKKYQLHYENAFNILPSNIKSKIISTSLRSPLNKYINYLDITYNNTITDITDNINKPSSNLSNLMIVGFYTINTPYEQEALKTISSCKKLNLKYNIEGVPNLGSWQANTRYKAKYLLDILEKFPNNEFLYIDCDSVINEKPILFNNYKPEIAVRWQDFRWRKNECLSGTIYFKNTQNIKILFQKWLDKNLAEPASAKSFEQWNLGLAIEEMRKTHNLNDANLPPEYCQFDLIEKIYPNLKKGKGVVQHYQKSRIYRCNIKPG